MTSILRLSFLTKFEQDLCQLVREHNASLPAEFLNFVASVEAEYGRHQEPGTKYEELPIHQYRLIRRFSFSWRFWTNQIKNQSSDFLMRYRTLSSEHDEIDKVPSLDLSIAAYSLSRIRIYYKEHARLLSGPGSTKHPALTDLEILELAALVTSSQLEGDKEFHKLMALYWIELFNHRVSRSYLPHASVADRIASFLKPLNSSEILNLLGLQEPLKTAGKSFEEDPSQVAELRTTAEKDPALAVCRHQQDRSNGNHYCFIFHSALAPYVRFHYEILSLRPYVAIVHNFLAKQMAHRIISNSLRSPFEVAAVLLTGNRRKNLSVRLSESTHIDPRSPASLWLDHRVQEATLLQPNSITSKNVEPDGEPAQVVNYGVGGFYRLEFGMIALRYIY